MRKINPDLLSQVPEVQFGPRTIYDAALKRRVPYRTQIRSYDLITPLFGGGTEAGKPDEVMPVNGKTVRGQLRFWWRVMRGGLYDGDLSRMKAAEDALWGKASLPDEAGAAQVQVAVRITRRGEPRSPFQVVAGRPDRQGRQRPKLQPQTNVAPAYIAFPLQPTEQEMKRGGVGMPTKTVLVGVKFELEIAFPVYPVPNDPKTLRNVDVEAALWAWETFGGVGARTRRGFGALKLTHINGNDATAYLPSNSTELTAYIAGRLRAFCSYGLTAGHKLEWPESVPFLTNFKAPKIEGTAHEVWSRLIGYYREFRQAKPDDDDFGRSLWPEPDSLRGITGEGWHNIENDCGKFPRAMLGLPIIFHFKDDEVKETTLQGVQHDRLASPLILKPVACSNNKMAALVAGLIPALPPIGDADDVPPNCQWPVRLMGAPGNPVVDAHLTVDEAKDIVPLNGNPNVIDAFLSTLP